MTREVDVAVIGAGSAGLAAYAKVSKKTDNAVLINGGELGTTCARVGCMPSKAAIQIAEDYFRRHYFDRVGIEGSDELAVDHEEAMEHVRDMRDIFVDKVLMSTTDEMGDEFIEGYAQFVDMNTLKVGEETIRAKKIIIATGSRPLVPAAWESFRDKIITTDEFFEMESLPASVAVIGLGVIGLELGQTLHRLGVNVTGIDLQENIGGIQDPVVNKVAVDTFKKEFPLWLGQAANVEQVGDLLKVSCGDQEAEVEKILISIGRVPNLDKLALENAGFELDDRGIPVFNRQTMQIGDTPVFIAGDVNGERAILHEANDEGKIAGYNAMLDKPVAFKRQVPLAITFSDPNIAMVGQPFNELDQENTVIGEMPMGPLGRALIMGKNKGVLRLYAEKSSGKILGAEMVAPKGENLAHLLAWSIRQELTVFDLLKMPYYHPAVEEALQGAVYDLFGKMDQKPEYAEFDLMSE